MRFECEGCGVSYSDEYVYEHGPICDECGDHLHGDHDEDVDC